MSTLQIERDSGLARFDYEYQESDKSDWKDLKEFATLARAELLEDLEDKADVVSKALCRAFQLGQTYWQQADSEYYSQNAKADITQAKFQELVDETRAAITRVKRT